MPHSERLLPWKEAPLRSDWASGLYRGNIAHARYRPLGHTFNYRIFMLYLDLDELEQVFEAIPFWRVGKGFAAAAWRREDYADPEAGDLKTVIREKAAEVLGYLPNGPVRMLTHIRYLGFCFNPVTFYYCFHDDVEQPVAVVSEINNTPWDERFSYVTPYDQTYGCVQATFRKAFHVSPFFPMNQDYRWFFSEPGSRIRVHMENFDVRSDGCREKVFDAFLVLDREPLTAGRAWRAFFSMPLITLKAVAAIYYQALRLKWKGAPFFSHPDRSTAQVGDENHDYLSS